MKGAQRAGLHLVTWDIEFTLAAASAEGLECWQRCRKANTHTIDSLNMVA